MTRARTLPLPRPRFAALLLCMALTLVSATSAAQANVRTPPASIEITDSVRLEVGQGKMLQLPRAAAQVLVADPTIASFQVPTPRSLFLFAEKAGTTTLYALDEQEEVIAALRLDAVHDLDALAQGIEQQVPNADIELVSSGSAVIVRGRVDTPQQAKQVIDSVRTSLAGGGAGNSGGTGSGQGGGSRGPSVVNQLEVELSAQINIQVRIVEVSRSLSSQLGFNWSALFDNGDVFLNTGVPLFDAANGATTFATINNAVLGGVANSSGGSTAVAGVLSALSQEGLATVLAEPNLTAMSGETAGFAAGGEVPVVIITNNNVSIEYKQYGVIMRMTPTLLSPNRISLHVAPEVSELTDEGAVELQGSAIPAFVVRRADTTVELASGQSFALAGMLRSSLSQQVDGLPGLKNLPLLGGLFQQETSSQKDTELVIIATAYVVEPTAAGSLQTPGRGIAPLDAQLPEQASAGYLF